MATNCIFCRILAGDLPGSLVYRDEQCAAFLDIHPINPGHLLVVPLQHASGLADLPPDVGGHLFRVGQRLSLALRQTIPEAEGINLLLSDGAAAGQEVFHVHLHVIPRHRGDGSGFRFRGAGLHTAARPQLDQLAADLAAHL
ncbi:Diadenosine tetraphosphate (Ap4A) hydrolase [Catalinimonas alkaloidigena]|uniref:Diadenosine tetraphosphate (Ap4A) hydrolase n=1 Tax=Catalinimonas alkaloidigena TaxID=1075417 RepID=A0A1G9QND5_9BACT|nr:HIT family protein [Catalinimonas alkaloidigena]SDM12400.1 Diadenosine tetraphosphate (Ap4A) hydrolase [Catalinimonas alkaloidigena]